MLPLAMESMPASNAQAVSESLRMVDEADLYVVVLAHRYGTKPLGPGKSITHREYDEAVRLGVPVFAFLMHPDHQVFADDVETGPGSEQLRAFKQEVLQEHVVAFFKGPLDLMGLVFEALIKHTARPERGPRERPATGGGRRVDISRLTPTGEHFSPREEETRRLFGLWDDPGMRLVEVTAFGGVGKSALVQHWLRDMERGGYHGAERVFAWSFYRQGTDEASSRSTVEFFEAALRWFGHKPPFPEGARERANALVRLVCEQRTLLILDGLEPHQHRQGPGIGRITDDGLQVLVRRLTESLTGLCIITTREPIKDAAGHPAAARLKLPPLSPEGGIELLVSLGVMGTAESLRHAYELVRGHPLSLNLLGRYLGNGVGR